MSRIGDQRSPFGVTLPKAGNRSPYRLMVATMQRIREIRPISSSGVRVLEADFRGLRGCISVSMPLPGTMDMGPDLEEPA